MTLWRIAAPGTEEVPPLFAHGDKLGFLVANVGEGKRNITDIDV